MLFRSQAEMNAGGVLTNIAEATDSLGDDKTAQATTSVEQSHGLLVVKDADHSTVSAAGVVIGYTISVENTGNVELTNVVVTDDFADKGSLHLVSGDTNNDGILQTTETWVYGATHTVTQAEMDAGTDLVNTATVKDDQGVDWQDSATTTVEQNAALTIDKVVTSITGGTADKAGDEIDYTITVKNTGNVTLTEVSLTDLIEGASVSHTLATHTETGGTGTNGDGILDVRSEERRVGKECRL